MNLLFRVAGCVAALTYSTAVLHAEYHMRLSWYGTNPATSIAEGDKARAAFPFVQRFRKQPFHAGVVAINRYNMQPQEFTGVLMDMLRYDPRNVYLWWNVMRNADQLRNLKGRRYAIEMAATLAPNNASIHNMRDLIRESDRGW